MEGIKPAVVTSRPMWSTTENVSGMERVFSARTENFMKCRIARDFRVICTS
ncbi:hypothetical protein SK128_013334 [Halocaridina rubra]|uniref:Uncharacterized protein n=1 Tax=Halocaridina rubra TaxID=373956 RepID=A0AAN9A477_HALRR